MSAWVYLVLLVAAFVAFGVYLDRRWKRYAAGCDACIRRERALAKLVSESEAEIHRAARDERTLRVAGLVSVAPVVQFPAQRGPGSGS